MKKLSDYDGEIYITQTEKLGGGHRAYCMDGGHCGRGDKGDMARDVGLTSCHCCDYFLPGKGGGISFLEMKDILQTKRGFKEHYYPGIPRTKDGDAELFMEHIANVCILKLYGSMLVLCWFAPHLCSSEAARLRPKQYHFFLVVPDAPHNKDAKMLDGIKRRLDRRKSIASKKRGASGVICEVHVLSAEKFKRKLEFGDAPPA